MDTSVGSVIFGTAIGAAVLGFAGLKKYKDSTANEKFKPTKKLGVKDELILAMLDDVRDGDARPCYVITDPALQDNPIVFASPGFCSFTKYTKNEVEGRNCRFLQGPDTDKDDIKKIRDAVHGTEELSACLLNYKKDGTTFINQVCASLKIYATSQ
jgi:PAS domain-containing protein